MALGIAQKQPGSECTELAACSACTAVYLLDDGKDAEKKKWMHSLNLHNVVYIRCGCLCAGALSLQHMLHFLQHMLHLPSHAKRALQLFLYCHLLSCSGRKRKKGEINGKSANINHAMALIYPSGADIPLTEASAERQPARPPASCCLVAGS